MRLIAELSFFKSHNMIQLMPVVNFFKKRVLRLGQPIVRQGDLLREFGVVAKGRCKVVDITTRSRSRIKNCKVKGFRSKLRNMKIGNLPATPKT